MNQETDEHSAIRELLTLGNEYCHFIENQMKYSDEYRLQFIQKALPALYLKGSLLRQPAECDTEWMQRYVTEENYEILFNELREKFGKKDLFNTVDPISNDVITNSLSESLCDLYQDMKDLFITFSKGYEAGRVCAAYFAAEWFMSRWGIAIAKIMPVVHELVSESMSQTNME